MMKFLILAALLGATDPPPSPVAAAQAGPRDPAARAAVQREAMEALAFLDGAWRGGGEIRPYGKFVQTERVGTLLGGTVRLVEGRGYDLEGKTVFNALGIISFDPARRAYTMRSYAEGYAGDYPLTVRPDGFSWAHPMGPGATLRYNAVVKDGTWHETGERVVEGQAPVKVFEMRLSRVGETEWPGGGAVPAR